jgi:hypothetical protein
LWEVYSRNQQEKLIFERMCVKKCKMNLKVCQEMHSAFPGTHSNSKTHQQEEQELSVHLSPATTSLPQETDKTMSLGPGKGKRGVHIESMSGNARGPFEFLDTS